MDISLKDRGKIEMITDTTVCYVAGSKTGSSHLQIQEGKSAG